MQLLNNNDLSKMFYTGESKIHGTGLFARSHFKQGDYIGEYDGPVVRQDGMHVLWVEEFDNVWMGRDGQNILRFLNHSKKPQAEFSGFELYALIDINKDQEITIDYGEDYNR